MEELVAVVLDRIQTAAESLASIEVEMPTGLGALDLAFGGLRSGDLVLLTGSPGSGKSSLALNFLRHIAIDSSCPAVLFSLQSKGEHVLSRMASEVSGIPLRRLGSGRLTDSEWERLVEVAEHLGRAPLLIFDQAVADIDAIDAAIQLSTQRFGRCAIVAVDYASLLHVAGDIGGHWVTTLTRICCDLKVLARRRDCAVLLLESSGLRGSLVELMPEADVILELKRTGRMVATDGSEQCEIRILKQQHGPACTVLVHFAAATACFRSP